MTEACGKRNNAAQDRGRNNIHTDKKSRAETSRDAHKAKNDTATNADKAGNVVGQGYLKCLTIQGPKQQCDAFHRNGAACAKMLDTGKCHNFHTFINDVTKANQLLWFGALATQPNFDFNTATVTCFEVVAGKFVHPT